jgi:hypothetical protein
MENIKQSAIPQSLWQEDPEFAQELQDVHEYLQKTPFSKIFPKKHKAIIKDIVLEKTGNLFQENPNRALTKVVATVLNDLNDDLSEDFLLEITRLITQEWQYLSKTVQAEKDIAELV